MIRFGLSCLIACLAAACARAEATLTPVDAARGAVAKISGLPAGAVADQVMLHPLEGGGGDLTATVLTTVSTPAAGGAGTQDITFAVPVNAPFGRYSLRNTKEALPVSTPIRVTPPDLKLSAVAPAVWPEDDQSFNLTLIGEGFSSIPTENVVSFRDQSALIVCPSGSTPKQGCTSGLTMDITSDGRQIVLKGIPASKYAGKRKLKVQVADKVSEEKDVLFSSVRQSSPRNYTIFFFGGLCVLILFILRSGKPVSILDKQYIFSTLFLDLETRTYSLSKFQFYVWTAASVLGYVFLTASKSLVQGDFAFADIPDGLPGILLASAGTAVLSVGISGTKGSKGAGEKLPSASDFITTGGVVAPERLQFFVWTIVGVASFLGLVFQHSPDQIQELPKIPERFMELMGISAAGYLGGKLARKAGPKLDSVTVSRDTTNPDAPFIAVLKGAALSKDATFQVDGKELVVDELNNDKAPAAAVLLTLLEKDDSSSSPGLYKGLQLRVPISRVDPAWLTPGTHDMAIFNPDAQKAVWEYEVPPADPKPPAS